MSRPFIHSRKIPQTWTYQVSPYTPPAPDTNIYVSDPLTFDYTSFGKTFNLREMDR